MTQSNSIAALVGRLIASWVERFDRPAAHPPEFPVDREILSASAEEQRAFVMAAVEWLEGTTTVAPTSWPLLDSLVALLRRSLPFTHDDLLALLGWANRHAYGWRVEPHLGKIIATYLATNPRTPALEAALAELIAKMERRAWDADARRRVLKLKELAGVNRPALPLLPGDVWADAAIAELGGLEPDRQMRWAELLQQCAAAGGSAPSAKWRKATQALVERIGPAEVCAATLRWFALAERPRETTVREHWGAPRDPQMMQERNVDALRGLVWLCAEDSSRETARALAALVAAFYRKLPGVGPRSARLGNAGIWALGQMSGQQGMAQLATLKTRVKLAGALKQIETALAAAAERAGLPADEVEELLVPTYGLAEVGFRREQLGDVTAELVIAGAAVELRYIRADGKRLAAAPKALKAKHGAALAEITQAAADIKAMLPAQRDRIEQLFLQQKAWPLAVWRERYLDHPLVGALARRLIWRFSGADWQQSGIWHDGQLVGLGGQPLTGLDKQSTVALWHPLDGTTAEVLAWREWLLAHELQQPFKQAFREVYLLTDAERTTAVYSNRFAAHILRQHQFNALCVARGWKNQLRLMVDDSYPPAMRLLPQWGLRAEFWVEGVGDEYGQHTNDTGTYLYLATDQVRFYPIDAAQHYAHAGGGGYQRSWFASEPVGNPVPLTEVPALVLSEVLRDVDLFVGVASVGNDPNWSDGGPQGQYRDYWRSYAFGELSETAKTRRAVLERLLPRLTIGKRCALSERFLRVRGDIRSYKIHLGSGNILMEPNDQYLCIVPARGATAGTEGTRFVPFEGDGTLAIILSKALLLAEDTKITDPTITRQLQR